MNNIIFPLAPKYALVINQHLKFYCFQNKPNNIVRFFQRILLGITWEDVK